MDSNKYLFYYVLIMRFIVHHFKNTSCFNDIVLTPKLTVSQNNNLLAKNESYIDLEAKQTLYLNCEGNEPFRWVLPDPELLEYIHINTTFEEGKYLSEFIFKDIQPQDAGYYYCQYNTTPIHSEVKNHYNSIYVFVTDKSNLFVESSSVTLCWTSAVNNSALTISCCRPSSSFTQISLWTVNEHNSTLLEELSTNQENDITYDPKVGFHLKYLKEDKLKCIARLNDTVEQKDVLITFSNELKDEPIIEESNGTFIFVGDNFYLNCKMIVRESSFTSLMWTTDVCTKDWGQRLTEDKKTTKLDNKYLINHNISVTNAQLSDEGIYKCIANGISNHKEVTKEIKIYDSPELKLYSDYENVTLDREQPFNFSVNINSVPNEEKALSLIWMKNGKRISENDFIINRNRSHFTELIIQNVDTSDSGIYTLEANLLNILKSNVSLTLTVRASKLRYPKPNNPSHNNDSDKDQIVLIIVFTVFGAVLLVMAVFLGRKIREERKQKRELEYLNYNLFKSGQMELLNPDLPLDEQIDLLPYDNKWEFPRENLKLGQILGQGAFGRVVRADAYCIENSGNCTSFLSETTTVAVKMLKERADMTQRRALLAELKILIHVGKHMNIVNLLGAVTKDLIKGELMVIVEYCRYGNIRSFLLAHRTTFINQLIKDNEEIDPTIVTLEDKDPKYANNQFINNTPEVEYQNISLIKEVPLNRSRTVTTSDLVSYVFQCAKGMEYLSSKKLIHRDLAARNVLLADDDVVKICDFGLARDCYNYDNYVKKGEGPLPIKWMAIESMRDKVYTTKSDVWSFGIYMWEMFTLGANPYPGFDLDQEFYKKLLEGYRMERPDLSPINIYSIMKECWKHEPTDRPDFTLISNELSNMMETNAMKRYDHLLEQYNKNGRNSTVNYMRMNSESDRINDLNYVDMTANDENTLQNMVGNHNPSNYDDLKNVRSINNNNPTSNEPMEVVPMIHF